MITVSDTDRAFAADVRRRDELIRAECVARGFTSKRNGWTSYPSGTTFAVQQPTNADRGRAELIEFRANPPTGSYAAYLTRDPDVTFPACLSPSPHYRVTTFTGDTLAHITRIKFNRAPLSSWLSDQRGSFWARGIDGRMYHGRHNGVGLYLRMRPAKRQP